MIPPINLDTILSDPLLLTGTVLLIVGPLIFLIALVKFLTTRKETDHFSIPADSAPVSAEPIQDELGRAEEPAPEAAPIEPVNRAGEITPEEPEPPVPLPRMSMSLERELSSGMPYRQDQEKTVVLAPGVAELQAQIEIAISQIKHLNKKTSDLEDRVAEVAEHASAKADPNQLKEPPMDAADFTQKLLKLAQHVIVLEKEVAKLKGGKNAASKAPAASPPASEPPLEPSSGSEATAPGVKPPIMPL